MLLLNTANSLKEYTFNVTYFLVDPDHAGDAWVQGINGVLPGPTVRVRQHERLRITVYNYLQTEVLSLHWHGFEMRQAQEYDGAMLVTQCGIPPGHSFVYDFIVDEHPGTYQYHEHAHLEHVAARGLFGSLIVDPPEGVEEPWQYDHDEMIMLFDWWKDSPHEVDMQKWAGLTRPPTVSNDLNDVGLQPFWNVLINGKGGFAVFGDYERLKMGMVTEDTHVSELYKLDVNEGETWRLRVENGGALFAVRFRIDGHRFQVIQTDAADVEPYWCDVLSMSAGERFDILVIFDQTPGSYWIRLETLEDAWGIQHGNLGVLRYRGTAENVLPNFGYPKNHRLLSSPELVTINCVDQGPISPSCRPVTDLRHVSRPGTEHLADMGTAHDTFHDFEVSFRGFGKPDDSHFTRVSDLQEEQNTWINQFDGPWVQFMPPALPFSHTGGSEEALHPNSLAMHVQIGETVRVILQIQDRTAHPWHLHGHKFAVLAIGFPDYNEDCDIVFCRNKPDKGWWARDGMPKLLDPAVAPLKDTVHIPPGGWAIIQFKADNPGWWFFHCHMLIHVHDGMGLVLIEGDMSNIPQRLANRTYLEVEKGFPDCHHEIESFEEKGHYGTSCSCWENPEIHLDTVLRAEYKCAKPYLCGQLSHTTLDPDHEERSGARNRAAGRPWRIALCVVEVLVVVVLMRVLARIEKQDKITAEGVQAHVKRSGGPAALTAGDLGSTARGMRLTWSVQHVTPSGFTVHKSKFIRGELPAASVCALLGEHSVTEPWLRYFGGRSRKGNLEVVGDLELGGCHISEWSRFELQRTRSYVYDVTPVRPQCDVVSYLDLQLRLTEAPALYTNEQERYLHLSKWMETFGLVEYANTKLMNLPKEVLMRMNLCRQMLLPRPFLFVRDPFGDLDAEGVKRMAHMFKMLAEKVGVTIVYSTVNIIQEACDGITHAMLLAKGCQPFFGEPVDFEKFCGDQDYAVDDARHPVEFAASLLFKGRIQLEPEKQELKEGEVGSQSTGSGSDRPSGSSGDRDSPATNEDDDEDEDDEDDEGFCAKRSRSATPQIERESDKASDGLSEDDDVQQMPHDITSSDVTPLVAAKIKASTVHFGDEGKRKTEVVEVSVVGKLLSCKSGGRGSTARNTLMGMISTNPQLQESEEGEEMDFVKHMPTPAWKQMWILLKYQLRADLYDQMTPYKAAETFGIGICAGIVWLQKGSGETQTDLTEMVGLLFFSTALWTVPPVFQALTSAQSIFLRFCVECCDGVYYLWVGVIAFAISTFLLSSVWVCVWQSVAYTMADLSPDLGSMMMMHTVLCMNVFTMRAIGLVLGLAVPNSLLNTVVANLVAQLFMLTNGFYTKLPPWFDWITVISIPRYTFRALLKLEFSWRDTYAVHPHYGNGGAGFPTRYVESEFTGFFQLMRTRGMNVMESPVDATAWPEIIAMAGISVAFLALYFLVLLRRLGQLEAPQSRRSQDGGDMAKIFSASRLQRTWST